MLCYERSLVWDYSYPMFKVLRFIASLEVQLADIEYSNTPCSIKVLDSSCSLRVYPPNAKNTTSHAPTGKSPSTPPSPYTSSPHPPPLSSPHPPLLPLHLLPSALSSHVTATNPWPSSYPHPHHPVSPSRPPITPGYSLVSPTRTLGLRYRISDEQCVAHRGLRVGGCVV